MIGCFGCSTDAAVRRFLPRETAAFALAFIDSLRIGAPESAQRLLTEPLDTMLSVRDSLARIRAAFPPGAPDTIELASLTRTVFSNAPARTRLEYQLRNRAGAALAQLVIVDHPGGQRVESARVSRLPQTLQKANAFSLAGKGPGHYLALLMTLGVIAFMAASAVLVARTRGMPRRWWWTFVACLGVGKVIFNWTTGWVATQLMSVQLLGASVGRIGLLGPWLLAFSFPLGAVVALERRQRYLRLTHLTSEPASPPTPLPPDSDAPDAVDQDTGSDEARDITVS